MNWPVALITVVGIVLVFLIIPLLVPLYGRYLDWVDHWTTKWPRP